MFLELLIKLFYITSNLFFQLNLLLIQLNKDRWYFLRFFFQGIQIYWLYDQYTVLIRDYKLWGCMKNINNCTWTTSLHNITTFIFSKKCFCELKKGKKYKKCIKYSINKKARLNRFVYYKMKNTMYILHSVMTEYNCTGYLLLQRQALSVTHGRRESIQVHSFLCLHKISLSK